MAPEAVVCPRLILVTTPTQPSFRLPSFLRNHVGGLPRTFWVLWSGLLVNRLGMMIEPFLAVFLTQARGLPVTAVGLVLALYGAGAVISQLLGGWLSDRIGRRPTLAGGMVATAAAMFALGYAQGIAVVVVATFLLGVAIDAYRPAMGALVADLVPPDDRPRAYGLVFWAVNLGFSMAMVAGGWLTQLGFQWLFWADAFTCLVFACLIWWGVPETRPQTAGNASTPGSFADVLRDGVMVAYVGGTLAYACVLFQAFGTLPLVVTGEGLSATAYGTAIAVNGIVIVIVQPFVLGWLGRRDHSAVLAAASMLAGLGFGLTWFASTTLGFALTVATWTLGEIAFAAVAKAVVADLAPAHLRGRYNGAFGMAFSGAAMLAPLAGTWVLDHVGEAALWGGCVVLGCAAAAGHLALGPAIRRRRATVRTAESAEHHPAA